MLQVIVSVGKSEHIPPLLSTTVLDLVLDCFPPPQVFEHFEYSPQTPHWQLTVDLK